MTKRDYIIRERLYQYGFGDYQDTMHTQELTNKQTAITRLFRINRKLHRIAEDDCNGNPKPTFINGRWVDVQDEKRAKRNEKTWDRLTREVKQIATDNDFIVSVQGDPRGSILSLSIKYPGGIYSDHGNDTELIV